MQAQALIPWIRELDRQGKVNLKIFRSYCGTYACLLGWLAVSGKVDGLSMRSAPMPRTPRFGPTINNTLENVAHGFGLSVRESIDLFGPPGCGLKDLTSRLELLDKIVERKLAELVHAE